MHIGRRTRRTPARRAGEAGENNMPPMTASATPVCFRDTEYLRPDTYVPLLRRPPTWHPAL
jgi:hypothetical protein